MEVQLYNGTVELFFDPNKHYYTLNGELVDGVTSALKVINKPALIPWAVKKGADYLLDNWHPGRAYDEVQIQGLIKESKRAYRQRSGEAADMGTFVHNWIEQYLKGENPKAPVNPRLKKATESFVTFWNDHNFEPLHIERPVASLTHKVAGTPDLIAKQGDKLAILDWKSGSGIYPEAFLQMGAYALCFEEEFGETVDELWVVNASVRTKPSVAKVDNVDDMKQGYIEALNQHRRLPTIQKHIKQYATTY